MNVRISAAPAPLIERRLRPSVGILRTTHASAEILVHAIAQLPDAVSLDLPAALPTRRRLQLLATAYGIQERIRFTNDRVEGKSVNQRSVPIDDLLGSRKTFAEIVEALTLPDDPPASLRNADALLEGQRVAVVTNLPTHYRVPLFSRMSQRLDAVNAGFRVFFLAKDTQTRPWLTADAGLDFGHEYTRSIRLPVAERPPIAPLDLEYRLRRFAPTVVLAGGFSPLVSSRLARVARLHRAAYGIWSGETRTQAMSRSPLRRRQRSALVNRADFAVAYGFESASYLHDLRPDVPLVYGRNTSPAILSAGTEVRSGRSGEVEVLVVGDLASERKGVDIAIEAIRSCPTLRCRLTVIGDGKVLPELHHAAGGDTRVRFLGSQPPTEVARAFGSADIVLFPTRSDIFGLVLVEAMGAGVATVASGVAGAVADLAVDGLNCLVAPDNEPRTWANCLSRLVADPVLRQELGNNARATIARRWTMDHAADSMLAGLRLGVLTMRGVSGT